MKNIDSAYDYISQKISYLKSNSSFLKNKRDDFAFTVLCIKSNLFKNPSLILSEDEIENMMVDGVSDGGVDAILSDPNSETSDLILVQSKYYVNISYDDVRNAITKLVFFYQEMEKGNYTVCNPSVQNRFVTLNAEIGEESKVRFVFYTSAQKSNAIKKEKIEKIIYDYFKITDHSKYQVDLFFAEDIVEEIIDSESRRPSVEKGKLIIDKSNNALYYNDHSAIINISAFSLKELFIANNTNLLSRNLRYYIKKKDIDDAIKDTIKNNPDSFWYKNNGLTIVCNDFVIDGRYLKLKDFSIVNGGQTTTLIWKSEDINKENDFYLPCKVVRNFGISEDEKNMFSLEIAKATNSQKAIKSIDLKSNAPEQVRFSQYMKEIGIFYQTKRGEVIPKDYKEAYKNTDLANTGKLCLAAIFQRPATSRNKPSTLYKDAYYNVIFNGNQKQVCQITHDLLYIDNFFRKIFLVKYDKEYINSPTISFAHNARTICIAFTSLAARYSHNVITNKDMKLVFFKRKEDSSYDNHFYDLFKNLNDETHVINPKLLRENKIAVDKYLYILFCKIINEGYKQFCAAKEYQDSSLNETNYLKNDKAYYAILHAGWNDLYTSITECEALF